MGRGFDKLKERWQSLKKSSGSSDSFRFIGFVAVAAVLWFTLSMNDSVQDSFDVGIKIVNVPDSITFISDPPKRIHVSIRDKGTALLRNAVMHKAVLQINFNEYSQNNTLLYSKAEIYAGLRDIFGSNATIVSVSVDSIRCEYTSDEGRRVPIDVVSNVEAAPGYTIAGSPIPSQKSVLIYSNSVNVDTVLRVFTNPVFTKNLSETTEVEVGIAPIRGVRIVPSKIKVRIPVESMVKKSHQVDVRPMNAPAGHSMLLFPSRIEVSYYVPMSRFSQQDPRIEVVADYQRRTVDKLAVEVMSNPDWCVNVKPSVDSVEFTLVQ